MEYEKESTSVVV